MAVLFAVSCVLIVESCERGIGGSCPIIMDCPCDGVSICVLAAVGTGGGGNNILVLVGRTVVGAGAVRTGGWGDL